VSPECQRIAALKACAILDTAAHPAFDCLTRAAALAFDAPIALVSLVDTDRQWFKSVLGVDLRETPRNVSFCTHTIEGFEPMVVPDAMRDLRFFANPLVTGSPHGLCCGSAPCAERAYLDTQRSAFQRQGEKITGLDGLGGLPDAVDLTIALQPDTA